MEVMCPNLGHCAGSGRVRIGHIKATSQAHLQRFFLINMNVHVVCCAWILQMALVPILRGMEVFVRLSVSVPWITIAVGICSV